MSLDYVWEPGGRVWTRAGDRPPRSLGADGSLGGDVVALQNESHRLLNEYLNGGGFSRLSRYLFPWPQRRPHEEYHDERVRLGDLVTRLERQGRVSAALSAEVAKGAIENALAAIFRALPELMDGSGIPTRAASARAGASYRENDYRGRHAEYLAPVRELVTGLRRAEAYCEEMLLHGSMATLDYAPGFSDLDTLLIVRHDVAEDPAALRRLQQILYPLLRHMYRLDPLQHHGFFVITGTDRALYPEHYFPLELFTYAKSLGVAQDLPFALRPVRVETRRAIWDIVQWMRAQACATGTLANLHEFKLFLSFVLLLPALYLQACGHPTYKKFSFEKLAAVFDGDCTVLEEASRLRRESFADVTDLLSTRGPWPPPVVQRIGKRAMARRTRRAWPPDPGLLRRGLSLAEALYSRTPE